MVKRFGVPLEDALREFSDKRWREYHDALGGNADVSKYLAPESERDRRVWALRNQLEDDLLTKLRAGDLEATGYPAGGVKADTIPASAWGVLEPDFDADTAEGNDVTYREVRVHEPSKASTTRMEREAEEWLRQFKTNPARPTKNELCQEMVQRFGVSKHGARNRVWPKVFSGRPGRPRRNVTA